MSSPDSLPRNIRQRGSRLWAAGASGLGALCTLILFGAAVDAAGRAVTYRGLDGRTLTGLFMEADERPAPAVVLVPMLGRPKDDWEEVAERLADADINTLAIDLRSSTAPGDAEELARWHEDIDAAVAYLLSRSSDVRPAAIGVLGASLGANLAAVAAARNPDVRSLALVSPSLDYRGVRIETPLRQYGGRPALLMASLHDPFAARSVRELAANAPGIRQIRWSEATAHGTVLLARDPDLVRSIVEWFQQTLG